MFVVKHHICKVDCLVSIASCWQQEWACCYTLQNEVDRESETSSLNIDLGFPDEEDDHQPDGKLLQIMFPSLFTNNL